MTKFCASCGALLKPGKRFCGQCGRPAASPDPASAPPLSSAPPPPASRRTFLPPALTRQSSPLQKKPSPALILAAVGGVLLLCVGAVTGGVLLLSRELSAGSQTAETRVVPDGGAAESSGTDASGAYILRQPASGETVPESVQAVTSSDSTTLSLSDGTRVELPGGGAPVTVVLSRQSNNLRLPDKPDLQTSGSMRTLEYDIDAAGETFLPRLTIPAAELGQLDLATVNLLRIGDVLVDGEILPDQMAFLPVQKDASGNLVALDVYTSSVAVARASSGGAHLASSARSQSGRRTTIKYVLMTFQAHLEWQVAPTLVRMIPDASSPGYRRPANMDKDEELLLKPVVNVVVLVHGHNELEKDGSSLYSSDLQPWGVEYKREVWTEFYKTYLDKKKELLDCTAFYEYIYPTYRAAYSPIAGNPAEPLGDTLAKAVKVGALNDGYQLKKIWEAKMPVNLYFVAHSMGGLVARAGLRQLEGAAKDNFQQLVTWGSPHHGSPLVSMGYIFRSGYKINFSALPDANWFPAWMKKAGIDLMLGSDLVKWGLDFAAQLDTPGTRDLRWDNFRPLRLDEIFTSDTNALVVEDPEDRTYNLNDGAWLYNDNLRVFNQSDPYAFSDKYTFLYGVTTKRLPASMDQIAVGATFIPLLLRDSNSPAAEVTSGHVLGDSDGAVPLLSMAGAGIVNFRSVYVGDIDHEAYYSSAPGYGDKMASHTFHSLGLEAERCDCAVIKLENPEEGGDSSSVNINAKLSLDPKLDPAPGKRIETAEALYYINGTKEEYILGDLDVEDNGKLTGSFEMPDLGEGAHQLVVRATFKDGTRLESTPTTFTLISTRTILDGSKLTFTIEGEVAGGVMRGVISSNRSPLYYEPYYSWRADRAPFTAERKAGSEAACAQRGAPLCGVWNFRFAYIVTESISQPREFSFIGTMELNQQGDQVTGSLRYNISQEFYEQLKTWESNVNTNMPDAIRFAHDRVVMEVSGKVGAVSAPAAP